MDLAVQTDARIVLIGDYQLVHASCARNNWLRRQHMVHLRRYDRKIKSEYVDFVQALKNLLANLPTEKRLKVLTEEFAMKLYVSCVGCIGTLKKTLHMALQHALRTDEDMTEALILSYALPNSVALQILKEARIGEHLLTDIDTTEVEKMLDDDLPPLDGQDDAKPPKRSPKVSDGKKPGFRGGRIGERKPTRDPVGGRHGKPR